MQTIPEGYQKAEISELVGRHSQIRFTAKIDQVITIPQNATVLKRPILDKNKNIRTRKDGSQIFAFYLECEIDGKTRNIPLGTFNSFPEERTEFAAESPLSFELVNATDDEARYHLLCGKKIKATKFFEGHGPNFLAQPDENGRYPLTEMKFVVWSEA